MTGPPNVTRDLRFSGLSSEPRGSGIVGKGRRAQVPDKPPHPHPIPFEIWKFIINISVLQPAKFW